MALTSDAPPAATPDVAPGERAAVVEVEEQLSLLARTVRASMRQTAAAIDPALTPFGLKILRVLARSGPMHSSSVAEFLEVDRSIVSRHAKHLEEQGLIELRPDPSDGRCRFLEATEDALARMAQNNAISNSMLHHHLDAWSNDDLRQFAEYLHRLGSPTQE
jgi:DNA-binding MarR family transcriptional regulator